MKTMIVIPARLGSTRLPEKMMLRDTGSPLVVHTLMAARRSQRADRVIVATDSELILSAVRAAGGEAVLTDPNHASGTDRVAEVARQFGEFDMFVNLQGDEPEIDASHIDRTIEVLRDSGEAAMSTIAVPIDDDRMLNDPSCVKVVLDRRDFALYFSRCPIPFVRDTPSGSNVTHWQHVGLYVYRRDFLLRLSVLERSPLELAESLEQLRVLENGFKIAVSREASAAKGIDTVADYREFVKRILSC